MSTVSMYKPFPPAMLFCALSLAACDKGPTPPPEPLVPSLVTILAGDNQIGLANSTLRTALVVQVTDSQGRLVPGVTIEWVVEAGGGSAAPRRSSSATNDVGIAADIITLGAEDGPQTIVATVSGMPASPHVTFTATAVSALVAVLDSNDYDCWYYGVCSPSFSQSEVVVPTGKTVGWIWVGGESSSTEHNVTFEDDPTEPASSPTQTSGRHIRTFTTPGVYRYRCTLHSENFAEGMVGTVTVQ